MCKKLLELHKMKKTMIFSLVAAGIALSPLSAFAQSDSKYPAADFQPEVVFIDEEYAEKHSDTATTGGSAFDPQYPAANFEPKVIFADPELAKKPEKKAAFDPKYPAANFEPKVIFADQEPAKKPARKIVFDPKYPAANFEPKVIYP